MNLVIDFINNFMESLRSLTKLPSKAPQAPPITRLLYRAPVLLCLAYIGSFIIEAIYNTSNHPLADFPGPKLAAATAWYKTWIELFSRESWIEYLEKLHKKYGMVIRMSIWLRKC